MLYRYTVNTHNARIDDVRDFDPEGIDTQSLLSRGFIVPVEEKKPVAETRETKPSRKQREAK